MKNSKFKRLISLFLAAVLSISAVCISAGATQPQENAAQQESESVSVPFFDGVGLVFEFLKKGLNDITVYMQPVEEGSSVNEIRVAYTQNNGERMDVSVYNYYDSVTGEVFDTNPEQGVFGSGFNYNAHSKTFYAANGCWQRQFGFTPLYDMAANSMLCFEYITRRIFFEYDNREWMIQIWKGNYAWNLLVGAEIGLYNRPKGTVNGMFYNCATDDEMIPMSMRLYDSEEMYINRTPQLTWWMTGFKLTEGRHNPYGLTLESELEFPNEEMCNAFVNAAKAYPDIRCTTEGTTVSLKW